ncbi:N-succinylarginine dihydrolase [uncultured Algimonas sp.]|uniref:N-succinylarginine dihydrolase n=1 Tax=uncultured Algimonas sp. TaxID=1547920 RepID=UPI00261FD570|nr:N-succinylarginine dihydrolase [uncultured Algimonas sp.]
MVRETNFDGLVGPTHNYAGLSRGNIASAAHKGRVSNPRAAALQGLAKMERLLGLGLPQGVIPPHDGPRTGVLRALGFTGTDGDIVAAAYKANPALLANVSSASSMWTANAATVSPAPDTADGRVHFTPANLISMPHRALEHGLTTRMLRRIFADESHFAVHDALPMNPMMGDEGAANHNRLCRRHGEPGLEVFVHGRAALNPSRDDPRFPARQTLESVQALARRHAVSHARFLRQNPAAIDAGAFHNDVVCVVNEDTMLYHALAFENPDAMEAELRKACEPLGFAPRFARADMPIGDAVASYVFNSQLVSLPEGGMAMILPTETQETPSAKAYVDRLLADGMIGDAHYLDLRQSMSNGGGPACLRLRVAMSEDAMNAVHPGVIMTKDRIDALRRVVTDHYRDRLTLDDIGDAAFLSEVRGALDALSSALDLPKLYDFQNEAA